MNPKQYITISRCEDEAYTEVISHDELTLRLNRGDFKNYEFITKLPHDLNYFPENSVFIMCGEVIIPKAEKTVTTWKI